MSQTQRLLNTSQQQNFYEEAKERAKLLLNAKTSRNPSSKFIFKQGDLQESESVHSVRSLRDRTRQEQLKSQLLKNRLKFVKIEHQRNVKAAEWAKRKYSQIVTVRNRTLEMKSHIEKERDLQNLHTIGYLDKMKNRNIKQRQQKNKSVDEWRKRLILTAYQTKLQSQQNSHDIDHYKHQIEQQNKRKANLVRLKQAKIVQKLSSLERFKLQKAKQNYHNKLSKELTKNKQILTNNKSLVKKLLYTTEAVRRHSEKKHQQLQQFQQLMNLTYNLNHKRFSYKKGGSIFITKAE